MIDIGVIQAAPPARLVYWGQNAIIFILAEEPDTAYRKERSLLLLWRSHDTKAPRSKHFKQIKK